MKTPNKTKRLTRILTSAVLDALRIACQLATALFIGQPSKQAEMPVAAFQQLSWRETTVGAARQTYPMQQGDR